MQWAAPMKINHPILLVATSWLLAAGACKKNEASQPTSGSAAAEGGAVKAAKPDDKAPAACPPTAWKEPGGLFCIDAPGFTTKIEQTDDQDDPEMRVYFKKEAEGDKPELHFRVQWFLKRGDAATQAVLRVTTLEDAYKNNRGKDQGAMPRGTGKYFHYAKADDETSEVFYAVVEGKQFTYECEARSYQTPLAPELVAACKSLLATD